MAKYIKSDGRVLSEEEQQRESNSIVALIVAGIIVWLTYSVIGIDGAAQKITLIVVGLVSLFLAYKFIGIIYLIAGIGILGTGGYYLVQWIIS